MMFWESPNIYWSTPNIEIRAKILFYRLESAG